VYAVGLADGRGVAVKIADGSPRARSVVLSAVLRRIGLEDPDVPATAAAFAALDRAPVLGHGQPVGSVVAVGL
jgi:L-asparaginase II